MDEDNAKVTRREFIGTTAIGAAVAVSDSLKRNLTQSLPWLRRCDARADFTSYCKFIDPHSSALDGGYSSLHLRLIAEHLERVESGEIKRLFITCPPRHWKSSEVAEKFPGFYLGKHPERSVGLFSFEAGLVEGFSRNVRDTIAGNPLYHELYPKVAIREDMSAVDEWATLAAYRSSMMAFGVDSRVRGKGFDLIIVDDPLEDKAAHSKEHREKVLTWYKGTLRPRLEPGGAIILIMSRAHKQDLAGVLMEESRNGGGEKWVQLHLKAISDGKGDPLGRPKGEALWPARWPIEELEQIRKAIGSRAFAAQYQGEPRADDTAILDSSKLIMCDLADVPKRFNKLVRYWDLAFSDKQGADYTAGVKMGVTEAGHKFILHLNRIHGRWPKSKPIIIKQALEDGVMCIQVVESNGTQLGYYQDIRDDARMGNRTVVSCDPEGNKEMRASVWGSRLVDGVVHCVRAPWNQELFDEMDYFGSTDHDDIVDAVSGAWAELGNETGHYSAAKPTEQQRKEQEERGIPERHGGHARSNKGGLGI